MQLTKEQRIARHKDFLKANWIILAAFAWEHYQTKGAGAVLVPEEDFVHSATPELKGLRFHYLPIAESDKKPNKGILSEKELAWLKTYDSDAMVVLCVLRPEGGVSSYLFGGETKPSVAYAQKKAKEN